MILNNNRIVAYVSSRTPYERLCPSGTLTLLVFNGTCMVEGLSHEGSWRRISLSLKY